jgi:hypothetical protein
MRPSAGSPTAASASVHHEPQSRLHVGVLASNSAVLASIALQHGVPVNVLRQGPARAADVAARCRARSVGEEMTAKRAGGKARAREMVKV